MITLNENALKVAESRYIRNDNGIDDIDWDGCCNRVASAIASIEKSEKDREYWKEKFYDILSNLSALGGGRILRNAGTPSSKILNCHVLPLNDSIEEIGEFIKKALVVNSEGGGVGCVPNLRPIGTPIKTKGGKSSGLKSFLEVISNVLNVVESGGNRRSGLLPIIPVSHPEILDIIDSKLDHSKLNNFNISAGVTNKFLDLVEKKEKWKFTFNNVEYGEMWASDLFDKIVDNNLKSGEPGIVNLDNMKISNSFYFSPISSLNLCQPGWAPVLTKNGVSHMEDISIGDLIWTKDGWSKVVRKINRGLSRVFRFRTNSSVFYGTEDHEIVSNGEKVPVNDAESIDSITGEFKSDILIDNQTIMDGLVIGDGSIHKASNNLIHLYIGKDDHDYFTSEIASLITKYRPGLGETAYEIKTCINYTELPYTYNRKVPDRYKFGSRNIVASFLRGLYSANGSVILSKIGRSRIQLATSSEVLAEDVQIMLSSIGIRSYITKDKNKKPVQFSNGIYTPRDSYIINITWDRDKFFKIVGFIQQYKNDILSKDLDRPRSKYDSSSVKETYEITEKEFISEETVYSITVDNNSHTYWSGGCNVMNCGELKLSSNQSCCLGSIILPNFVSGGRTNWSGLEDTITTLVRFLDNALDYNKYSFTDMKEATMSCRRLGLGVIGLGDYLFSKEAKYGSEYGINKTNEIIRFLRDRVYEASSKLAEERGSFPGFQEWAYTNAKFVKKLPARIRLSIKNHGIRNCTLMAFAPGGTISLIANTTSGIEPLPAKAYRRKDRVGERLYIHSQYKSLLEEGKEIPDWLVDSLDLSPEEHFETTVAIMSLCDGSISKTQTMSSNMNFSTLKEYLLEYSRKLVGITLYVDGTRKDQIITKLSDKEIKTLIKEKKFTSSLSEEDISCNLGMCEL
uniref:Putative ribonucleoside diphosphate reductase n=1 Tax=viral metagenome TaxID=1070528 RepID=A0A6H1ZPU3_9ZZZZ